ncbi:MAG: DNA adenine methylase [Planctomycetota bacterium]
MSKPRRPISALLPWYGSKRTLAPLIVELLGEHRAYVEPFGGSMAVLLRKARVAAEVVNDLHGDLVNLARVMSDHGDRLRLFRRCRNVIMYDGVVDDAKADLTRLRGTEDRVGWAAAYYAMSWLGLNGFSGTDKEEGNVNTARRYTLLGGGSPTTRWRSAVNAIRTNGERLAGVDIRSEDALDLLEKLGDVAGQVIYVDPPYFAKGAKYRHDFAPEDHQRLAARLCRFEHSRVVVSYYADDRLQQLYPGWWSVDASTTKALHSQGRRDSTHAAVAPEVLLCNFEPHVAKPITKHASDCEAAEHSPESDCLFPAA